MQSEKIIESKGAAVELAAERSCQPRVILETRSESLNPRAGVLHPRFDERCE